MQAKSLWRIRHLGRLYRIRNGGGGAGGNVPGNALLWPDGTPMTWPDGSFVLWPSGSPAGPDLLTDLYADFAFSDGPWAFDGLDHITDSEGVNQWFLGSSTSVGTTTGVTGNAALFTNDDGGGSGGGFASVDGFFFGTDSTFSFEIWIKSISSTGNSNLVLADPTGASWYLQYNNSGLNSGLKIIYDGVSTTNVASKAACTAAGWHQIVGTFNGAAIVTYFDGALVTSGAITSPTSNATGLLVMDQFWGGNTGGFTGDNMRFWDNRVLDATDVTWLWNSGASRTYSDILASG